MYTFFISNPIFELLSGIPKQWGSTLLYEVAKYFLELRLKVDNIQFQMQGKYTKSSKIDESC